MTLLLTLVVLSLVAAVLLAPIAWYDLTQQIRFPVTGYAQSGEWMYSFMLAYSMFASVTAAAQPLQRDP